MKGNNNLDLGFVIFTLLTDKNSVLNLCLIGTTISRLVVIPAFNTTLVKTTFERWFVASM